MSFTVRSYQASFDLLLKDLREILEFVEPVDANKAIYSHRIYGLLLRVCTDFESLSKDLLVDAGSRKSVHDMNIYDYRELEKTFHLERVDVDFLLWQPNPLRFTPFSNWASSKPPLHWYQLYNTVKHNRSTEFSKASLDVLIEAEAGLFSLIAKVSDFKWGDFSTWRTDNGIFTFWRSPFQMSGPE